MSYVLIIIFTVYSAHQGIAMQEFDSLERCKDASVYIKKTHKHLAIVECLPK